MGKNTRKTWLLVSISLLVAGAGWIFASRLDSSSVTPDHPSAPQKGFLAPDFTLKAMDGDPITLSSLRGKVVLVNFWASWCPPCQQEIPAMEKIYRQYENKGFVILAVNSTLQDTLADVADLLNDKEVSFPVLLDNDGKVTDKYQIQSLPTSFFINQEGMISQVVIGGPMSEVSIQTEVEQLLQEMP